MEERIKNLFNNELRNDFMKNSERSHLKRHTNWVQNKIYDRRNFLEEDTTATNISNDFSMMIDEQHLIMDTSLIEDCVCFFKLNSDFSDKTLLKNFLKKFRKELVKTPLDSKYLEKILFTHTILIENLTNFLFDFKNSEIQLEILSIFNMLFTICQKFSYENYFMELHKILCHFMHSESNFSNNGVKNLIFEKFFSLVSNLIIYEPKVYSFYLENNILVYLVKHINSSVRSLRYVCLLAINNIITMKNSQFSHQNNMIDNTLYFNRDIVYYYKFLLNRIDPSKNFPECYEFLWLMVNVSKENFEVFFLVIFKDDKQLYENVKKLIGLAFYEKLHQPVIRIMANLISVNNNYNLKIVELMLIDQNFLFLLSNLIQYNNDISLINDIIWLIKSLSYSNPVKIRESNLLNILFMLANNYNLSKTFLDEICLKNLITIFYYLFSEDCFTIFFTDKVPETFRSILFEFLKCFISNNVNYNFALKLIILEFLFIFYKITCTDLKNVERISNFLSSSNL
jgi:hypothetical protein